MRQTQKTDKVMLNQQGKFFQRANDENLREEITCGIVVLEQFRFL